MFVVCLRINFQMAAANHFSKSLVRRTSECLLGFLSTPEIRKPQEFRDEVSRTGFKPGTPSNISKVCYSLANFLGRKQTDRQTGFSERHLSKGFPQYASEFGRDSAANTALCALDCLISSHLISPFYRVLSSSQPTEVIYFRYKTNHVALIKFSTHLSLNRSNRLTLFLSSKKERERESGGKIKVRQ